MKWQRSEKSAGRSAVVMVPGLNDDQFIFGCAVHKTMLVIDPPRPEAGQIPAQRLRLAGSLERGPPCFLDEPEHPAQHLLIGRGPVGEVFPALSVEDNVPQRGSPSSARASSSSIVLVTRVRPRRTSSAAAMRRAAFAGERSR